VRKLVLSSSASVYGLATAFPTPETHHPYDNRTMYGAAKLFNEGLLRSFHDSHGLDYVALRYFNVYGPRMDTHGAYTEVIVRWMERIASGLPPQIFGDGAQTMDFVYVDDVARANLRAAMAPVTDEVLNIGSGVETSLRDLARRLLQTMGSSLDVEYEEARRVNPVPRRLADLSRAKSLIGFTPAIDVGEGLIRVVEWWRRERQAHVPAQV
jgi:UDP-glucose 4-epimerase